MKPKNSFKPFKLWRLRYRMYAILLVTIVMPVLFAGSSTTPQIIEVFGRDYSWKNFLVGQLGDSITPIASNSNTGSDSAGNGQLGSNDPNSPNFVQQDQTGLDITEELRNAGYDLGTISSQPFLDLNLDLPGQVVFKETEEENVVRTQTLNDLVPAPANPQRANFLTYPKYRVNAPVIYTSFQDLFETNGDEIDFTRPIDQGPIDSPVQEKLKDGIVHLAFTPQPGEIGNSYIVGHSSNYSFIKSAYNSIFKPLEKKTQPGEEFFIYDRDGRELRFEVFEAKEILAEDTAEAYKSFGDEDRVVTLQTSILEFKGGRFQATKRWLTRGRLVV